MKILPSTILDKCKAYIQANCSPLTQALYTHNIEQPNTSQVLAALSRYQNADGGFGYNLEGDFELPDSSPMATSIAFQLLVDLAIPASEPMVKKGIAYLLAAYDSNRPGWITVPPQVNDYAHASWWHFNSAEGGSSIDHTWGNPTAELLCYLLHYPSLAPAEVVKPLYDHTLDYLLNHPDSMEMHEVYCFLRLAEQMPEHDFAQVKPKLTRLVLNAVNTNPESWKQYAAQPLNFVNRPQSFLFPLLQEHISVNLDFRVDNLAEHGIAIPPWDWTGYAQAWQAARIEISGRLTVADLAILKRFGRLDT